MFIANNSPVVSINFTTGQRTNGTAKRDERPGKHMQTIAGAISVEDWALVATTAPLIASHPQTPLAEKARIIRFMGSNMGKFKAYDMETHEAAHEMEHAAHEQNGQQVIAAYHKVQSSCLSCHQTFRASFVEYFYGKK